MLREELSFEHLLNSFYLIFGFQMANLNAKWHVLLHTEQVITKITFWSIQSRIISFIISLIQAGVRKLVNQLLPSLFAPQRQDGFSCEMVSHNRL